MWRWFLLAWLAVPIVWVIGLVVISCWFVGASFDTLMGLFCVLGR